MMPRLERWILPLLLAACHGSALAQADGPVQLLPDTVAQGADLRILVSGGPPGSTVGTAIRNSGAGGDQELPSFALDRLGNASVQFPLPPQLPVGTHTVEFFVSGIALVLIDSDPLTVTPGPGISLDPGSGYRGQTVDFNVTGLQPGGIEIRMNNTLVFGPQAVSSDTLAGQFNVPGLSPTTVDVVVENYVGDRSLGVGIGTFDVLGSGGGRPVVGAVSMPATIVRDETFTVTGTVAMPAGSAVGDYDWTMTWGSGQTRSLPLPVNITAVEFDPDTMDNYDGAPVSFSAAVHSPSLSRGYFAYQLDPTDELGFVNINPDTGETGSITIGPVGGIDDYEGITINGRLVDAATQAGLAGGIWTVEAETQLIEPGDSAGPIGNKASGSGPVNSAAALVHGNNQLASSVTGLGINNTPAGCPITLSNGVTDENGDYFFAFSPKATEFLNSINKEVVATAGGAIEVFPPGDPARNEFLVRISGLPIGYGVEITDNDPTTDFFAGIRYEFQRTDQGIYRFREGLEGPFNQSFPPGAVLTSDMDAIPPDAVQRLPVDPFIVGMNAQSTMINGSEGFRFFRLFSFPSRAGTALDQATIDLRLPWAGTQGGLDATVELNGQFIGGLAAASDTVCDVAGTEYSLEIPGLATIDVPDGQTRIVSGTIFAGIDGGSTYQPVPFEIVVTRAPQWWRDTDTYDPAFITWSAEKVFIRAGEKPKANDATADNVPNNVGTLNNTNDETASVHHTLLNGLISQPTRVSTTNTTVANQQADSVETKHRVAFSGLHKFDYEFDPWESGGLKNSINNITQLRAAIATCGEDNDDCDPEPLLGEELVILDTGKIPLFRYSWGVPPIVAATLGADIWFKALFRYYVYLDFQDFMVDIDGLAEPEITGGIDVFFDLSALFGLVSASVTAAPALGVAMPIVITNTSLDTDATVPCFNFVLDLLAQFRIGPCPLCLEHLVEERVLEYAKPDQCTVAGLNKFFQFHKAASAPANGTIGVDADGYGSAAAIYAGPSGITAVAINGGSPGQLETLDSGPGAMRPDAAYFDAGKAVAVWSQSSLSQADFDAQPGALQATPFQHMVYAVFENGSWGSTADLTLPTTGEGGVSMAGCRASVGNCPADGEVLAVWERDRAGDISQHALKLDYALFDGGTQTWSAVQTIDAGNAAKDVQPEALYVDGEPVVVWVRNPSATPTNLNLADRELWYEFLNQGAGPLRATGLPKRVASPSAAALSDGTFAVTFSKSTDVNFIGNRRALWIAQADNCLAGTCDWSGFEPRDQYNRRMFVENPSLVVDLFDNLTIVGRQVGVDGEFQPGESIGIVTGAGDLFKLELSAADLTQGIAQSLSNDGAVNWNTAAIVEPTAGVLLAFNSKGTPVADQPGAQFSGGAAKSAVTTKPISGVVSKGIGGGSTGVFMNMVPRLPDYAMVSAVADTDVVNYRDRVNVTIDVQNLGILSGGDAPIVFEWDRPPEPDSENQVGEFDPVDGRLQMTFEVRAPRGIGEDRLHRLYVAVNPGSEQPESDGSNNVQVIEFNRMPVPQNLRPGVDRAGTMAFLDWDDPLDDRVYAYRVWRRQAGTDQWFAVGFTDTNGFVDLNVVPEVSYEYRVTSVSDLLNESESSEQVMVIVGAAKAVAVFQDGFETP
ncbi:MAG: fibronectin type III domain-containing protein [Xanthomonadales bacterium]|nr:fibronectin type III domain-containing protein [Xanthomonadales bacterium]